MVKKSSFTISKKIWVWPGGSANWYFMYVDGEVKDTIRKIAKKHHMGMVKVSVKIGKTVWETSLFPHKKEDCYLLPIKRSVRDKEDIFDGDVVTTHISLI